MTFALCASFIRSSCRWKVSRLAVADSSVDIEDSEVRIVEPDAGIRRNSSLPFRQCLRVITRILRAAGSFEGFLCQVWSRKDMPALVKSRSSCVLQLLENGLLLFQI